MSEEPIKPNPSPEQFAALQEEIQKLKENNAKLLDQNIKAKDEGELILLTAIQSPYKTILDNAGLDKKQLKSKKDGIDVVTGKIVNMIKAGIIDPVLVTKTALINAASVASTIISADCIISNVRDESN